MKRALAGLGLLSLLVIGPLAVLRDVRGLIGAGGPCEPVPLRIPRDAPVIRPDNVARLDLVGVLCQPEIDGLVNALAFLPEDRGVASAGRAQPVRLWELSPAPLWALDGEFQSLALDPSGTLLLAGGNGSIRGFDVASGETRLELSRVHRGEVRGLVFVGSDRFVSAGQDGKVALWQIGSREPLASARTGDPIWALAVSPERDEVATAGDHFVWRLRAEDLGAIEKLELAGEPAWSVVYDASSERVFLGGNGRVRGYGREGALEVFETGAATNRDVALAPSGDLLAAGRWSGQLQFWRPSQPRVLAAVDVDPELRIQTIAFSPSGRLLAAAGEGGGIHLFAVAAR